MRGFALAWIFCAVSVSAQAANWLAGVDTYAQPSNPTGAKFTELFAPNAPWDTTAQKIQVLKVSTQFLHAASDSEVSDLVRGLRRRHVALAMEGLLLVESERCGRGIESYGGRGAIQTLTARLKRLGGSIEFVAMDEPLWYGNYVSGPRNCSDTVESLAEQMAGNVQTLKAAFPAVQFGDIEPVNNRTGQRIEIMLQFAKAFKAATGWPISFVDADIIWQESWRPQLVQWRSKLHDAGIRLGVIFDGDPTDATDELWAAHAIERYHNVMADDQIRPDDAIFQSWMMRPTRFLPDTDPETLTGMVRRALE